MVGQYIAVFVKNNLAPHVKAIKKHKTKTGLAGYTGNKGSVAIRFAVCDTSFAFVNVHLESG